MSKPKLKDFKTYLATLDEAGLREELLKLFGKLPQVQEFYAQELLSDTDRKAMLEDYNPRFTSSSGRRAATPAAPAMRKSGN